jgi:hypothetical protein
VVYGFFSGNSVTVITLPVSRYRFAASWIVAVVTLWWRLDEGELPVVAHVRQHALHLRHEDLEDLLVGARLTIGNMRGHSS